MTAINFISHTFNILNLGALHESSLYQPEQNNFIMTAGCWIETNWGESYDNVTGKEITAVLQKIFTAEKADAVFWIGDNERLHALEVHKNFNLHYIYGADLDQRTSLTAQSADQCRTLISMFFKSDFLLLKNEFNREKVQIFRPK